MTQFDRITLGRQARELGFVRDTFEKVCRLADVLAFLESDALLSKTLALKGGTAINLTIFDLPRLSVDIDLDYSENVPREEMLAQRGNHHGAHPQIHGGSRVQTEPEKQNISRAGFFRV